MFVAFGAGIVVGILVVVGLISLTMRDDLSGCIIPVGLIVGIVCWALIVIPWFVLFG